MTFPCSVYHINLHKHKTESDGFVLWFYGNENASSGPDHTMDNLCSHLLCILINTHFLACYNVCFMSTFSVEMLSDSEVRWKRMPKFVLNNQPSKPSIYFEFKGAEKQC